MCHTGYVRNAARIPGVKYSPIPDSTMAGIAVDAMGGDRAPVEIVYGAVDAARRGIDVVLVGDVAVLDPILDDAGISLPIAHADEVVEMADDPARAIREKKHSSIAVAAKLVADGEVGGLVSAGSTGAAMASAALIIGRLPGVSRPAIASLLPNEKVLLDSGANLSCRAEDLVQFSIMGAVLARIHYHVSLPRVGLINIGEEEGKGRDLEKQVHGLLARTDGIDFVGNIDGRDLARDTAEVLVTDGFVGNVVLKTVEGTARWVLSVLQESLSGKDLEKAVRDIGPELKDLRKSFDPDTFGGAHLLGTKGVVVVAHGSSSRRAIANAIDLGAEGIRDDLVPKIGSGISELSSVSE